MGHYVTEQLNGGLSVWQAPIEVCHLVRKSLYGAYMHVLVNGNQKTNKPPTQMGFEDETREPIMQAMMGIKGRDLVGPEDRIRATGEDRGHPRTNLTGSCHTAF